MYLSTENHLLLNRKKNSHVCATEAWLVVSRMQVPSHLNNIKCSLLHKHKQSTAVIIRHSSHTYNFTVKTEKKIRRVIKHIKRKYLYLKF